MDEFEALALAAAARKRRNAGGSAPQGVSIPFEDQGDMTGPELVRAQMAKEAAAGIDPAQYGSAPDGYVMNPRTGQMEDMRSSVNPHIPNIGGNTATAAMIGAGQGLGFGGFDETVAGLSSIGGPEGSYDYNLARMREAERRATENNPVAYYGGMIPGAAASSIAGWNAAGANLAGKTLAGTAAKGAGAGATEGAIYGFLSGEGAKDRMNEAAKGIAFGSLVGGAAPAVVAAGKRAIQAGGDLIGGGVSTVTGKARQGAANRDIMAMLRKSGRSVDDVADDVTRAAQEGQPEYRLMDATGRAGQRKASGVVRSGGDGAEELAQFLEQRQLGQPERVSAFASDAFDGAKTAKQTKEALTSARSNAANVAYDAARKNADAVDVRGALGVIDDRIGGMQGAGVKGDGIDARLAGFRSRLAAQPGGEAFPGANSVELSDFDRVLGVKQDVQDAIGAAVRAGRNNEARELGKLVTALDDALEGASDGYRDANDGFREASRVIGAVDEGKAMAAPRNRAADTTRAFSGMNEAQQSAARTGYGDALLAKIEANTAPTANRAKPFGSPKVSAETDAIARNPELFKSRIARENAMWETQNRALQGSRTADNLMDIRDTGPMAGLARAFGSVLRGNIGQAADQFSGTVTPMLRGENEATRALIAKILMSDNPREALAQAVTQAKRSEGASRVAEALTRAIGREVTN